jgi:DNA-binding NtrC family response regulator
MVARRVLIVDDREPSRVHIARALRARGLETCEAMDGRDGLDVFEREAPDAVVTDMRMPHSDGFDLLERIRTQSSVPIFCVSAYPEWETALLAMRKGATYFYRWPTDFDRLIDEVARGMGAESTSPSADSRDSLTSVREEGRLETAEERRAIVESALRATRGNVAQAAELLRVSRRTLYHWMNRYGVRRDDR